MAVGAGAAVPRHVLDDRQHAAGQKAFDDGATEVGDLLGLVGVGACADHRMGEFVGDVEHGRAIDADPDLPRSWAISRATSLAASMRRRAARKLGDETLRGGIGRPMRRAHALHAPAFLIDQHGRLGAADAPPKFACQVRELRATLKTLRLNRMRPHGSASRKNARSSASTSSPGNRR